MVEFRVDNDRLAVVGLERHIVQHNRARVPASRWARYDRCVRLPRAGHDFRSPAPGRTATGRAAREDLEAEARRIVLALNAVD